MDCCFKKEIEDLLFQSTATSSTFKDINMDVVSSLAHGREESPPYILNKTATKKWKYDDSDLPLSHMLTYSMYCTILMKLYININNVSIVYYAREHCLIALWWQLSCGCILRPIFQRSFFLRKEVALFKYRHNELFKKQEWLPSQIRNEKITEASYRF